MNFTLTVPSHYKCDDESKLPVKLPNEDNQCHYNISECWNNIKQQEFKDSVDSRTTIEDPEDFTGLAAEMER